jgi:hypothetical protein
MGLSIYKYICEPLFGNSGLIERQYLNLAENSEIFGIRRLLHEDYSWFGPLGFCLVIPSLIYGLIKGDLFLRAVSLNLIAYAVIISNQIVWMSWNNRFFSLFFASSGVLVAYLLEKIDLKKFFSDFLVCLTVLILLGTTTFNFDKKLIKDPDNLITISTFHPRNWIVPTMKRNIWILTNLGTKRTFYLDKRNFPNVDILSRYIPVDSDVGIVTTRDTPIYHYLINNPQLRFTPFEDKDPNLQQKIHDSNKIDYIFFLNTDHDSFIKTNNAKVLWSFQEGKQSAVIQLSDQ